MLEIRIQFLSQAGFSYIRFHSEFGCLPETNYRLHFSQSQSCKFLCNIACKSTLVLIFRNRPIFLLPFGVHSVKVLGIPLTCPYQTVASYINIYIYIYIYIYIFYCCSFFVYKFSDYSFHSWLYWQKVHFRRFFLFFVHSLISQISHA